jgi:hypothetical protein
LQLHLVRWNADERRILLACTQVNTCSALALRYNDASVLENHHASCAFASMERTHILCNLSATEFRTLRQVVVAAILATDMSAHKTLLASVSARLAGDAPAAPAAGLPAAGQPPSGGFAARTADDRQLLVCYLLHSADLCVAEACRRLIPAALG